MVVGRVFGKTPRRRVVMTMSFDEAELMTHALEDQFLYFDGLQGDINEDPV